MWPVSTGPSPRPALTSSAPTPPAAPLEAGLRPSGSPGRPPPRRRGAPGPLVSPVGLGGCVSGTASRFPDPELGCRRHHGEDFRGEAGAVRRLRGQPEREDAPRPPAALAEDQQRRPREVPAAQRAEVGGEAGQGWGVGGQRGGQGWGVGGGAGPRPARRAPGSVREARAASGWRVPVGSLLSGGPRNPGDPGTAPAWSEHPGSRCCQRAYASSRLILRLWFCNTSGLGRYQWRDQ